MTNYRYKNRPPLATAPTRRFGGRARTRNRPAVALSALAGVLTPGRKPSAVAGLARLLLVVLQLAFISSCTTLKKVGRDGKPYTALHTSVDFEYLRYVDNDGTTLEIRNHRPSVTHSAIGNEISKGLVSAGTAAKAVAF